MAEGMDDEQRLRLEQQVEEIILFGIAIERIHADADLLYDKADEMARRTNTPRAPRLMIHRAPRVPLQNIDQFTAVSDALKHCGMSYQLWFMEIIDLCNFDGGGGNTTQCVENLMSQILSPQLASILSYDLFKDSMILTAIKAAVCCLNEEETIEEEVEEKVQHFLNRHAASTITTHPQVSEASSSSQQ